MLVSLTTMAETDFFQIGGLSWPLAESTEYLFNTANIPVMKVYDTDHTEFEYVFDPKDRQSSRAIFRVTDAYTVIATASADEDIANGHIALSITYDYDGEAITATTMYFNVQDITLVDNDGTTSWVYVCVGPNNIRKYGTTATLATIEGLM